MKTYISLLKLDVNRKYLKSQFLAIKSYFHQIEIKEDVLHVYVNIFNKNIQFSYRKRYLLNTLKFAVFRDKMSFLTILCEEVVSYKFVIIFKGNIYFASDIRFKQKILENTVLAIKSYFHQIDKRRRFTLICHYFQ